MNRRLLFPFVLVILLVSTAISFAQQAENVELVGRALFSSPLSVCVQDQYAYVGAYCAILVFDIPDPSSPNLVAHTHTWEAVMSLWASGQYLYAAQEMGGFFIYDIGDPYHIREVSRTETEGYVRGLFLQDSIAFVAQTIRGFLVLDVSDPENPEILSSYDTPGCVDRVFVSDTLAYLADGGSGLGIVSISNLSHPYEVGSFHVEEPHPTGVHRIWVEGSLAYVGSGYGLWIVNVSDPAQPTGVSYYPTDTYVEDVIISQGIAYLAMDVGGLLMLDVSDSQHVTFLASFDTWGSTKDLFLTGAQLHLIDSAEDLLIFDVGDPSKPDLISEYLIGDQVKNIYVTGKHAYVAENRSGLRILDITDPNQPTEIGSIGVNERTKDVKVVDSYAYVVDGNDGLRIVDVSDPTDPEQVGMWESPVDLVEAVFVADSLAYVLTHFGGLYIIDVSNPRDPKEVDWFSQTSYSWDVFVQDSLAYVIDSDALRIINVFEPIHPWEMGTFKSDWDYGIYSLCVCDTLAYIGCNYRTHERMDLRIIDVSDPTSPVQIGLFSMDGVPYGVSVCDSLAYLACYDYGFRVIDVSDPYHPECVGFFETDTWVLCTFCFEEYAYMGGVEGMYIFQYTPQVSITDEAEDMDPILYSYTLHQNLPNPFNPTTDIGYQIPDDRLPFHTTLKIYNLLGQEVRTLVDEVKDSGYYEVTWDGRDDSGREVSSGMYLYCLEAGDFTQTKKMTLIR